MEHLSKETIEKFARGEYPYSRLLEISGHLLGCRKICRENLTKIDPDFFGRVQSLENLQTIDAGNDAHFSEREIEFYVTQKYGIEMRLLMNAHFTKCSLCTVKLRDRDPDYITKFIKDNLSHRPTRLPLEIASARPNFHILVPAALSLLLAIVVSFVWLASNTANVDQARVEDYNSSNLSENFVSNANTNNLSDPGNQEVNANGTGEKTSSNMDNRSPEPETSPSKSRTETVRRPADKRQVSEKTKNRPDIIATTRSLNKTCEQNPQLAVTPRNEVISDVRPELRWKPYPDATGYRIYLSDSDNNLIEDSGAPRAETNYRLINALEANKQYEWKVVATLKDGKEIYSETARFSVGEKAKKLAGPREKRRVNEVRCLEVKH